MKKINFFNVLFIKNNIKMDIDLFNFLSIFNTKNSNIFLFKSEFFSLISILKRILFYYLIFIFIIIIYFNYLLKLNNYSIYILFKFFLINNIITIILLIFMYILNSLSILLIK